MTRETYNGRKISARALKGADWGYVEIKMNGRVLRRTTATDEAKALADLRRELDFIDEWTAVNGVDGDRWGAEWFVPGTFEICPEGIHPQAIGGTCKHRVCVEREIARSPSYFAVSDPTGLRPPATPAERDAHHAACLAADTDAALAERCERAGHDHHDGATICGGRCDLEYARCYLAQAPALSVSAAERSMGGPKSDRDDIDADKARNIELSTALSAAGVANELWVFHCVVSCSRGLLFVGETYAHLQGATVKAVEYAGRPVTEIAEAIRTWVNGDGA